MASDASAARRARWLVAVDLRADDFAAAAFAAEALAGADFAVDLAAEPLAGAALAVFRGGTFRYLNRCTADGEAGWIRCRCRPRDGDAIVGVVPEPRLLERLRVQASFGRSVSFGPVSGTEMASRKLRMLLPSAAPASGSLPGPRTRSATLRTRRLW